MKRRVFRNSPFFSFFEETRCELLCTCCTSRGIQQGKLLRGIVTSPKGLLLNALATKSSRSNPNFELSANGLTLLAIYINKKYVLHRWVDAPCYTAAVLALGCIAQFYLNIGLSFTKPCDVNTFCCARWHRKILLKFEVFVSNGRGILFGQF